MAHQAFWIHTKLPAKIVDAIEDDIKDSRLELHESEIGDGVVDETMRKSQNSWITKYHWITGFMMHYINRANIENFRYDLDEFDAGQLQYTVYEEGSFYNWHVDNAFPSLYKPEGVLNSDLESRGNDFITLQAESIRKLSIILQLSDEDSYEGGDVQLLHDDPGLGSFFLPKERGTIIVFDARTRHRVRKIKKGTRRSIVGWCKGPRWK